MINCCCVAITATSDHTSCACAVHSYMRQLRSLRREKKTFFSLSPNQLLVAHRPLNEITYSGRCWASLNNFTLWQMWCASKCQLMTSNAIRRMWPQDISSWTAIDGEKSEDNRWLIDIGRRIPVASIIGSAASHVRISRPLVRRRFNRWLMDCISGSLHT